MNDFQARIGVGQPSHAFRLKGGPGTVKTREVVADDGPQRGKPTGTQTEHWSGRVDATIRPATVAVKSTLHNPGA